MSWIRIDDGLCMHVKTFTVLDLDAVGLWILCLSYCGHELTDGFVPEAYVKARVPRPDKRETVKSLIEAGWMERVDGGYCIPQYLNWNPSKEEVEAKRAQVSKARSEAGKRGAEAKWRGKTRGKASSKLPEALPGGSHGTETGPVPIPNSSSNDEERSDPEHVRLAELLAEQVTANGSKPPSPSDVVNWANDVRLMVERDSRTLGGIEKAIRWSQDHEFWRANVRSMSKLRKQYDQMRLQAERERSSSSKPQFERQAKVVHLGQQQKCRRCETSITNEQANNQSGMCDECYEAHIESLTGEREAG